jgi:IclR family KDG regulon transcriptional repressor
MEAAARPEGNTVADGSITRTLRVLTAVCSDGPQTLKNLSEKTGLSSPTLLRTLRLMADEGFVTQQPDRAWRATMLVWKLGYTVNSTIGVSSVARGYTDRLTSEVDESSVFAFYEQGQVTYSVRSEPAKPVRAHIRPARSFRLPTTVTGRAVLAFLPQDQIDAAIAEHLASGEKDLEREEDLRAEITMVRANGYASGGGSHWPDVWAVAAPVFGPRTEPVGALGVSMPMANMPADITATVTAVVRAAADMTAEVGGRRAVGAG